MYLLKIFLPKELHNLAFLFRCNRQGLTPAQPDCSVDHGNNGFLLVRAVRHLKETQALDELGHALDYVLIVQALSLDDRGPVDSKWKHFNYQNANQLILSCGAAIAVVGDEEGYKSLWTFELAMVVVGSFRCYTHGAPSRVRHVGKSMSRPGCC